MPLLVTALNLPAKGNHVLALDGLRALAIAPVLLVHLGLVRGGSLGVVLFFVLSGFLIGSLLLDERGRTGNIDMRAFYVRRIARLYPALIAAMVLALVAALIMGDPPLILMLGSIALALTYTGNLYSSVTGQWLPIINFTWTLAQEEQFYLIAPWFVRRISSTKLGRWSSRLVMLGAALAVLRLALATVFPDAWRAFYVNPLLNADGMIIGLALALAYRSESLRARRMIARLSTTWVAVGALLAFAALVRFSNYSNWTNGIAIPATIVITAVLLAHLTSHPGTWISRLFALRALRWLGERAYGLYLYHFPIFMLFGLQGDQSWGERALRMVAALIVAILVTAASFAWLERPAGKWIRRLQQSRASRLALSREGAD